MGKGYMSSSPLPLRYEAAASQFSKFFFFSLIRIRISKIDLCYIIYFLIMNTVCMCYPFVAFCKQCQDNFDARRQVLPCNALSLASKKLIVDALLKLAVPSHIDQTICSI